MLERTNFAESLERLVSFYKELLRALDLTVDNEGKIYFKDSNGKKPLTINGLPVVLPTQENIRTAVEVINGVPTTVKVLFNPLQEDAIKGENDSLRKLRQIIELRFTGAIYQLGETLFNIFTDTEREINNLEIAKFATLLNRYKAPQMKTPVDDKTLTNWIKLYEKILREYYDKYNYIKLFSKRGGKINNIKYNRIHILTSPFVEELEPINVNKEKFLDVKLRSKDKHAYLSLFEFIYKEDLEKIIEGFKFGSLNSIAPSFHSLMLVYDFFYKSVRPIVDALFDIGLEDREAQYLDIKPLPIDVVNLGDFIDSMAPVIRKIPTEGELVTPTGINDNIDTARTQAAVAAEVNQTSDSNSPWAKLKEKLRTTMNSVNTGAGAPISQGVGITARPAPIGGAPIRRPMNAPIRGGYGAPVGRPWGNTYGSPVGGVGSVGVRRAPLRRFGAPVSNEPEPYVNPYLRGRG